MTPIDRQTKLKEMIAMYGEDVIFEKLQISRRTFDLYLKDKVTKMVPIAKLIRIDMNLRRKM